MMVDTVNWTRDAKMFRSLTYFLYGTWPCTHMDENFHRRLAKEGKWPWEWTAPLDIQIREEEEASQHRHLSLCTLATVRWRQPLLHALSTTLCLASLGPKQWFQPTRSRTSKTMTKKKKKKIFPPFSSLRYFSQWQKLTHQPIDFLPQYHSTNWEWGSRRLSLNPAIPTFHTALKWAEAGKSAGPCATPSLGFVPGILFLTLPG